MRSFTLTSDTAHAQIEQPFHVTLTITLAENVSHVDNVFLPTFFGAEEVGDVEQIVHGARGTTYRETLGLVAHRSGTLSITSAYLDAIDARDGKSKRFISNTLEIPVGAGPISALRTAARTAFLVAIGMLGVVAIFALAGIIRRRAVRPPVEEPSRTYREPPAQAAQPPTRGPREEFEDAMEALRSHRDRDRVLAVREKLWRLAGGCTGETLSDVLARPPARNEEMRRMLMTVERATFVEEAELQASIDGILAENEWIHV